MNDLPHRLIKDSDKDLIDAERYRYLRNIETSGSNYTPIVVMTDIINQDVRWSDVLVGKELDIDIDRAIRLSKGKEKTDTQKSDEMLLSCIKEWVNTTITHPDTYWTYDHMLLSLGRAILTTAKEKGLS